MSLSNTLVGRGRAFFPPAPVGMRGRRQELQTLTRALTATPGARIALVGSGGSGKSLLACAVGHRIAPRFAGGIHWLRVGAWDHRTLFEMFARRLGAAPWGDKRLAGLRATLQRLGPALVVLDNHESDRDMARFLDGLRDCPVTWLLTARRCLLSGVTIYPVIPPLVSTGRNAFPAVAGLTRLLRWNPLALDIAQALVTSHAATVPALRNWLEHKGIARTRVMDHEDDVPEVRLLVEWAWLRLPPTARRLLAILAHDQGDDMDLASLRTLARLPSRNKTELATLVRWHLLQEPMRDRFAVHAVVRYAVVRRTQVAAQRYFDHYVGLLERDMSLLDREQTHLFAAMDHAHRTSDLAGALRIERLLSAEDLIRSGK